MHTCQYCGAILCYEERCKRTTKALHPTFMFCCMQGRVRILLLKEPPPFLKCILGPDSGEKGAKFKKDIRAYNSMFAFSSMGGIVDGSINLSKGPYVFRMSGQNYHCIGSFVAETWPNANICTTLYILY